MVLPSRRLDLIFYGFPSKTPHINPADQTPYKFPHRRAVQRRYGGQCERVNATGGRFNANQDSVVIFTAGKILKCAGGRG